MNPEGPRNERDLLESKLTALQLGELPSAEAEALRAQITADPELARLHDQLKFTIGLVRESVSEPTANQSASTVTPLKLSDERRHKLLAQFKTVAPKEFAGPRQKINWLAPLGIAAGLVLLAAISAPNFIKSRTTSVENEMANNLRQLDGAKQQWALEHGKSLSNEPTMEDLKPYMGRSPSSELPKSRGETYVLGKVSEPVKVELDGKAKRLPGFISTRSYDTPNGRRNEYVLQSDQASAKGVPAEATPPVLAFIPQKTIDSSASTAHQKARPQVALPSFDKGEVTTLSGRPAAVNRSDIKEQLWRAYDGTTDGADVYQGNIAALQESERNVLNGTRYGVTDAFAGNTSVSSGALQVHSSSMNNGVSQNNWGSISGLDGMEVNGRQKNAEAGRAIERTRIVALPEVDLNAQFAETKKENKALGYDWYLTDKRASDSSDSNNAAKNNDGDTFFTTGQNTIATPSRGTSVAGIPITAGLPVETLNYDLALPSGNAIAQDEAVRSRDIAFGGGSQIGDRSLTHSGGENRSLSITNGLFASNARGFYDDTVQSGAGTGGVARKEQITALGDVPTAGRFFRNSTVATAPVATPAPPASETKLYSTNLVGYVDVSRTTNSLRLLTRSNVSGGSSVVAGGNSNLGPSQQLRERFGSDQSDVAPAKPAAPAPIPQPEILTRENAFSTFSLNVSDVSFKLAAASLERGVLPEAASIRSEEFINAFDYRDPEPTAGAPIAFNSERARYPFAHNRDLLRFSLKTAAAGRQPGRPLNLVLLLDNSGSMERADRVRIIREALRMLATKLQPQDRFSVVTFSRTARLWVDGVTGDHAGEVVEGLSSLTPEGGTNLEEAMNLAYATALKHYLANGMNRVVLLTDGAANLGTVQPETLKQKVESNRKQGIALDCFGIGWEGYNDDLLEVLSRNGDGRYGFLNTPEEAASQFAAQLAGALKVAASDVKVQVEFNPKRVTSYRQIGYAKHQLTKEQFRDNTVDAAEIGAAESGNALYTVEVNPAGSGPLCTVRVRFKVPGTADYREHSWDVPYTGSAAALEQATPAMRLAATASAFSEWLASSPFAGEVTTDRLLNYLSGVPEVYGADARPKKLEWMIRQAKSIGGK